MDSLVIIVNPTDTGQSFEVILAKLINPTENSTHFELDILAKRQLLGDMVFERLEEVCQAQLRRLTNDLDSTLKKLRKQQ